MLIHIVRLAVIVTASFSINLVHTVLPQRATTYMLRVQGTSAEASVPFQFAFACPLTAEATRCNGAIMLDQTREIAVSGMMIRGAGSTIWSIDGLRDNIACTLTEFHSRQKLRAVPPLHHTLHITCAAPIGFATSIDATVDVEGSMPRFALP